MIQDAVPRFQDSYVDLAPRVKMPKFQVLHQDPLERL